jgi:ABC-2 type transport system permease protein
MKTFIVIGGLEWKLLKRNRPQLLSLLIFIAASLYSIHYGNGVIDQQQTTLQQIREQQTREQQELVNGLNADTTTPAGVAAYEKAAYPSKVRFFLNYYVLHEPAPFARLSIGQRDVDPYYLRLNAQNLYLQMFTSEIANPRKLLAGNFDLSFVIIYLLPLLIITFTYNILSAEKENGTLSLLRIQPVSLHRIVFYKLLFWLGITTALLLLISCIAFLWSGIEAGQVAYAGWWLLITFSYTVCWFGLLLLVNAFNRSSAFNALWSLGLWLLFLVVIPAVLNLRFADEREADPTRLTDFIRRGQGLGESKGEKLAVLERFYQLYPQYRSKDTAAADRFFEFKSYSAYVTLLDAAAKPSVDAYYQQVWNRQQQVAAFDVINPAVNTQHLLNVLGHSGLEDAFAYRQSISAFHRELCDFCFKPLFAGRMMKRTDFHHIPQFKASVAGISVLSLLRGLGLLWLLTALTSALAYYRLRFRLSL